MKEEIKNQIHKSIEEYSKLSTSEFKPVETRITYGSPYYGHEEVIAAVDSLLGGWLAEGPKNKEFEKKFAEYIGVKEAVTFNSGSSSLLIAFALLKDKTVKNHMKDGDEVITAAVGFPTALSAITLNNLKPVFVDVDLDTYVMDPDLIEDMITSKTKALLVSHNIGSPCDMERIMEIAKKNDLFVVEDVCDSHGATFDDKKLGSIGDLGCFSFHAGHTLATGEGGAITFNDPGFRLKLHSFKSCGRDEESGDMQSYSRLAYKLRWIDLQAAMGLEQLKKSDFIVAERNRNFDYYVEKLAKYGDYLAFAKTYPKAKPSWFSVPIRVKPNDKFKMADLIEWLESQNIQTRPILGGNLVQQPAMKDLDYESTDLKNSETINNTAFYIGCHPNLTEEMREFVVKSFDEFFSKL